MNFFKTTKVFAYFSLFFAVFVSTLNAQPETVSTAYDVEAGTKLFVRMDNEINSKVSGAGDTFTATLFEPLINRQTIVLPVGSVVTGRITSVERASANGKNGKMTVVFQTLRLPDGTTRAIEGVLVDELKVAGNRTRTKALTVGGAAVVGAIVGAVSKASNGALIGAGIGAGAAAGITFLRKGNEVRIRADEKFEIRLTKSVALPPQDY